MLSKHSDATLVHRLHRWVFADSAKRIAGIETVSLSTTLNAVNNTLTNLIQVVPNEVIYFSSLPASCGLSTGTAYYVIAATTPDLFKVSLTLGGSAINLTASGEGIINEISVSFSAADIGKRALQDDAKTFWDVHNVLDGVPTWGTSTISYSGSTILETIIHRMDTAELTTSTIDDYILNPGYPLDDFRTLSIKLQITSGSDYQFTTYTLIHNDVTPYLEQAGANNDSGILTTLDADINVGGNGLLRIIVRPVNAITTYKAVIEAFKK